MFSELRLREKAAMFPLALKESYEIYEKIYGFLKDIKMIDFKALKEEKNNK